MPESWKKTFLSDKYEVSTEGSVRRVDPEEVHTIFFNKNGIAFTTLVNGDISFTILVSVLVLSTFERVRVEGEKVHYIDGDKNNNSVHNLLWILKDLVHLTKHISWILEGKSVILSDLSSGEVFRMLSPTDAAEFVRVKRMEIYNALRFEKSIDGYMVKHLSGHEICECRKVIGTNKSLVTCCGKVMKDDGEWIQSSYEDIQKYKSVELVSNTNEEETKVYRNIHTLVAEAFIGKCYIGDVIKHVDGNIRNNSVFNLVHVSHWKVNRKDEYKLYTKYVPDKRVVRTDPLGIKMVFDSLRLAAKATNISPTSISKCCRGKMVSCRGFKFERCE